MKIKTITAQTPTAFDKAVNEALSEGWELKRRDVLAPCEVGMDVYPRIYYAELERHETEAVPMRVYASPEEHMREGHPEALKAEECCQTCRHRGGDVFEGPCAYCRRYSRWEAEE